MPEWYLKEFYAFPGDDFYLKAFYDLDTGRTLGENLNPISWKDIVFYAEFFELDRDLYDSFIEIIRAMDNAYLEWKANKNSK